MPLVPVRQQKTNGQVDANEMSPRNNGSRRKHIFIRSPKNRKQTTMMKPLNISNTWKPKQANGHDQEEDSPCRRLQKYSWNVQIAMIRDPPPLTITANKNWTRQEKGKPKERIKGKGVCADPENDIRTQGIVEHHGVMMICKKEWENLKYGQTNRRQAHADLF